MKLFVLCTLVAAAYSLPLDGEGVSTKNVSALDSRIISGHEATLGQFPWHADLTISFYFFVRYCGGSLIDRLWVLTAAHCLKREGNRATHVSIWFGIIDVADASGGVARHSSEFYIHHKYDNVYNDIALIKLNEIVRDTENVHAIMLGNDVYPGFYVETSGFGDAEQGLGAKLHYAQLRILRECIRSDGHPVRSSEVCAAPGTGAVCYGDSGSALVTQENRQWKQVGVVEGGTTPGCNFGPVIFTRVTDFRNWIFETIESHP